MKLLLLAVLIIGVLGYLWYANLLPFDTPTELVKSSEKVKELSKIVTKNEQKVIYYSIQAIPNLPDEQIPLNALHKALGTWKSLNPNLDFVESDDPDIEIRWQVYASETHSGLATCNSTLFGILNQCVLDISLGDEYCNGNYVQNDENMVSNTIMHEIGHAIGLGHSADEIHLMYSNEFPSIDFDSQGFVVPTKFEEFYIGQKSLLDQHNKIQNQLESLVEKISDTKSQYDEYYKQYEYYDGKTLPQDEFEKAQRLVDKLNSETKIINSLIDQQHQLINQDNSLIKILNCYPNV